MKKSHSKESVAVLDHQGSPEKGRRRLYDISEQINQEFGTHTAMPISRAGYARISRLPTGIFELDYKTNGGIPFHKFTRIWGKKSTLKSTLCLRLIRQAQITCRHCKHPIVEDPEFNEKSCKCPQPRYKMADDTQFQYLTLAQSVQISEGMLPEGAKGTTLTVADPKTKKAVKIAFVETDRCEPMRTILVDAELSYDVTWVRANGVDPELVTVVGSKWAEQTLDTTEKLMLSHEYDLIMIDSVAALTPSDTIIKSMMEAPKMAVKATLMTRAFNKWMSTMTSQGLMATYAPTMVLVQQVRNTGIGKPWAALRPSASEAEEHALSMDIKLESKGYEFDAAGDVKYGNFEFEVVKNKVGGSPKRRGEFRFWLRKSEGENAKPVGDSDDGVVVMTAALEHGIGMQHKNGCYILTGENAPKTKLKTLKAVRQYFRDNTTVYADFREQVLGYMIEHSIVIKADKKEGEEPPAEQQTARNPRHKRPGKK